MDLNANNDDDPVEIYIEPQRDEQESTSASDQQSGSAEPEQLALQSTPVSKGTPLCFLWEKLTDSRTNQQQQQQHASSTANTRCTFELHQAMSETRLSGYACDLCSIWSGFKSTRGYVVVPWEKYFAIVSCDWKFNKQL